MLVSTEEEQLVLINYMTFSGLTTQKHKKLGGVYLNVNKGQQSALNGPLRK